MQDPHIVVGSPDPLPFLLVDSSDHTTPATGQTPTVYVSRNAGPFALANGTVQEIDSGWYSLMGGRDATSVGPLWLDIDPISGVDLMSRRFEVVPASGVQPLTVGSVRYPLTFLLTATSDHTSPLLGAAPAVLIRKVGGAFQPPAGIVREVGRGVYAVGPHPTDYNQPGPLSLYATAPGADRAAETFDVVGASVVGQIDRLTLTLLGVKALLVNSGIYTDASCTVTLDPEPFTNPSPPCCFITPGAIPTNEPLNTGGGRYSDLGNFQFTVTIIVRRAQDIESQDIAWLTTPLRGGYPQLFAVRNVLLEQFVYDLAGNMLTSTGIKVHTVQRPRRYGRDPMMAAVDIPCSVDVLFDMVLPTPFDAIVPQMALAPPPPFSFLIDGSHYLLIDGSGHKLIVN